MSEVANERNPRGQYTSLRDPVELYSIVRDAAELAARYDADPFKDPRHVSQSAWNRASHSLESSWGKIPRASEVCQLLRDYRGNPYSWRQLLEDVFTLGVNFQQLHSQRMSAPDRELTDDHAYWAANHVAEFLKVSTLRPTEYDRGRGELLETLPHNARSRTWLDRVLPNSNQLIAHAGSWDALLAIASLEPRTGHVPGRRTRLLTAPAMILYFYARFGFLGDESQLKSLQVKEDLACEDWTIKPLTEWHEAALPLIAERGLPVPNPHPSKLAPLGWEYTELQSSELPTTKPNYTRLQVLDSVHEFKLSLKLKRRQQTRDIRRSHGGGIAYRP